MVENGGKSGSKKCGKIRGNGSQKTLENAGTFDPLKLGFSMDLRSSEILRNPKICSWCEAGEAMSHSLGPWMKKRLLGAFLCLLEASREPFQSGNQFCLRIQWKTRRHCQFLGSSSTSSHSHRAECLSGLFYWVLA